MKQIVIYFSRSGENIINGDVVSISKGNTEIVAEKIANITGADLYKIEPSNPYPLDYYSCNKRAKEEYDTNKSSDIKGPKILLDKYDVIYIGFPIWYRSFPTIIGKFIQEHNLSNKIIKPFCTNDEGMFGTAEIEIQNLAKGALIKSGLSIHGSKVKLSDDAIKQWVEK